MRHMYEIHIFSDLFVFFFKLEQFEALSPRFFL